MLFKKIVFVIFLLLAMLGIIQLSSMTHNGLQSLKEVQQSTTSSPSKIKTISWIPYWDQENAFASFKQHYNQLTYISLFWYKVNPDGSTTKYNSANEDTSIISFAHEHNVKVMGLIANMADDNEKGNWDANRVEKAIGSEAARNKHIAQIMQLVDGKNFDGIDIDYEALKASQKDNFSVFIKELAQQLHNKNKILGVAVFPQTGSGNDGGGAEAQDLHTLGAYADQLYFMTYLEHGTFSDPGPLGSLDYISQTTNYALTQVPKEKVFMGIGLMGVAWRQNKDNSIVGDREDITFNELLGIASDNNAQPKWDNTSRSPYLEFSDENGNHIVWYENNDSIMQRFEVAKQVHIGGIALWRLGGEDEAIWQSLHAVFGS